ncbi:MAG: hypothetical protein AUF73_00825 [Thaumarchaeota archaeon 13_1_20CM_2_39_11]|nr:MAG: hypothetical protein AUF73_00825 [Thaumarchaeota archaeon 13_1_20CM_2_39_11]
MVKCLPSCNRYHVESRVFLVAILAVILVFSVYATEYSHAYALKKATDLPQKPTHKVTIPPSKHHANGKPIGRHS